MNVSLNPEAIRARLLQAVGDDADLAALRGGPSPGPYKTAFYHSAAGKWLTHHFTLNAFANY